MTLNQFLVINISLYIVFDMNARYARVSPVSLSISDMKNPHPIRFRYPVFRTLHWRHHSLRQPRPIIEDTVSSPRQGVTGEIHTPFIYKNQLQMFTDMKDELAKQQALFDRERERAEYD